MAVPSQVKKPAAVNLPSLRGTNSLGVQKQATAAVNLPSLRIPNPLGIIPTATAKTAASATPTPPPQRDVFRQIVPPPPDPKAKVTATPKPAAPYAWIENVGGPGFGTKDYEAATAQGYTNEDVSKYILANEGKFGPEGINVAENIQRKLNLPYALVDPQKEALANPAKLAKGIWRYAGARQAQAKAPKRPAGGSQFRSGLAIATPATLPQVTASDLVRGRRALMIQRSRTTRGGTATTMPLGFNA